MVKYILYRSYMLKNLGEGNAVEIYKSAYPDVENMHISTSENKVTAMFWVDSEITSGGEGMATQTDVDELNRRIQPAPAYPYYIMEMVRQHLGLELYDTSRDEEINNMSHGTVLDHVMEWEGIIGYGYTIPQWIKDIYGIELS